MGKGKEYRWGYIDTSGNFVIEPRFHDAWDFSEDLAVVKVEWARGYIDREGNFVIEPKFQSAGPFIDGVARVMEDDRWFYINREGHEVPEPTGHPEKKVTEPPLIPTRIGEKCGYANAEGEVVIPAKFYEAEPFSEGLARVKTGKTSQWGYINERGEFAFKAKFIGAEDFHDGLARVMVDINVK